MKKEVVLNDLHTELLQTCLNTLVREMLARKQLPELKNNLAARWGINKVTRMATNMLLQYQGLISVLRHMWEVELDPPPFKFRIRGKYITGEDYSVLTEAVELQISIHEQKNEEPRSKLYRQLLAELEGKSTD